MNLNKIRALSDAGRFDLCSSCSNQSNTVKPSEDSLTQAALKGIYHAHVTDGRTVPIFKTLMTDSCTHDCNYCVNSTSCKKSKTKFLYEPNELAKVFHTLHKNNFVKGLFLSSGIIKNSDFTTEKMIETVKIIRRKYGFKGYVHFKALPGVSRDLLKEANSFSTRVSINIESTSTKRIGELTSVKDYKIDILRRQAWIKQLKPLAGQTTQMVIGASGETDFEVMNMMRWEYDEMNLNRVYYSTFTPVKYTAFENKSSAKSFRGNRLYNVDWLYRFYNFKFKELREILIDDMLPNEDPKISCAKIFFKNSSADIGSAEYKELIRVPGIGLKTAEKIINLRKKEQRICRRHLKDLGVRLNRADPFIKLNGWKQKTLSNFSAR